jgi:hypothetical protein
MCNFKIIAAVADWLPNRFVTCQRVTSACGSKKKGTLAGAGMYQSVVWRQLIL